MAKPLFSHPMIFQEPTALGAAGGDLTGTYPTPELAAGPLAQSAYAAVRRTTNQSIPNATITAIVFDTTSADQGGLWNPGAPTRLTVQTPGYYLCGGYAEFAQSGAGTRRHFRLLLNGSAWAAHEETAGITPAATLMVGLALTTGNYLEFAVYHDNGAPWNILVAAGSGAAPLLWMCRIF